MDNNDIVQVQDVAAVCTSVLQTRRKVLAAALATPVLAALLAFPFAYYFTALGRRRFARTCYCIFVACVPVFIHWLRHYQSVLRQLDALDRRVLSGEIIYGSQVAFHSYR